MQLCTSIYAPLNRIHIDRIPIPIFIVPINGIGAMDKWAINKSVIRSKFPLGKDLTHFNCISIIPNSKLSTYELSWIKYYISAKLRGTVP
jgi:hypothetical protein